jgi:hypothetical protein
VETLYQGAIYGHLNILYTLILAFMQKDSVPPCRIGGAPLFLLELQIFNAQAGRYMAL